MNIEIIRNTLYKSYLEAFYDFCKSIGGETEEVMCEILAVSQVSLIPFTCCNPKTRSLPEFETCFLK